MNTRTVQPDQRIFAVYAGLTAGGYDIAQIDPGDEIAAVVHATLEAPWPAHVIDYFRDARAATCEANPYWPRAYMLVAAVMETSSERSWGYSDPVRARSIIESMPVDPAHRDTATIEWLMGLPAVIRQVATEPWFGDLWTSYADVVAPVIPLYKAAGEEASATLARIGIPSDRMPKLVIIPNPLQAWQIADGVVAQDVTYLILARPDSGSIVHEALHSLFAQALECVRPAVDEANVLYAPVRDSMIRMGYAWDDSPASWRRVWEESLVRAATIWAECGDCPVEAARAAAGHASMGFIYVPKLLECFAGSSNGLNDAAGFILECLKECVGTVLHL